MQLKEHERIDDLHIKDYKIIQNTKKFCFGMDAVLLSNFAKVFKDEKVLDLGTGTGIIPILLEAKTEGSSFNGVEIQEDMVEMANRTLKINKLEDKISFIHGDIKEADKLFPLSSFDVVTTNPPYMNTGNGLVNNNSSKTISRHEILCTLNDVIYAASKLVKVKGRLYMVHKPQRLVEIISVLKEHKLEPKRVRFVHPYLNKPANMVLIEAIRHGNSQILIEEPLIVYNGINQYTEEIYKIYGYKL